MSWGCIQLTSDSALEDTLTMRVSELAGELDATVRHRGGQRSVLPIHLTTRHTCCTCGPGSNLTTCSRERRKTLPLVTVLL
jgi:hypothetical protein